MSLISYNLKKSNVHAISYLAHYLIILIIMHSMLPLLFNAPCPDARQGLDDTIQSNGSTTFYPGGLLRCNPPSPAIVQPVLPVEDKRDRSNPPYRALTPSSQPFCPYPISTMPEQFEVFTHQTAKRVTMRVHSPRFPKLGSWETPRPELANST